MHACHLCRVNIFSSCKWVIRLTHDPTRPKIAKLVIRDHDLISRSPDVVDVDIVTRPYDNRTSTIPVAVRQLYDAE